MKVIFEANSWEELKKFQNPNDSSPPLDVSVDVLETTVRAHNALKAANIKTIGQLIECLEKSDTFLARMPNCGKVTDREIKNAVKEWQMKKRG